jgi:hypothetical protein
MQMITCHMRCKYLTVICSEHINYVQVIPECLLILLCPKHRPHTALLVPQPVQIFLRQEQMVRTHFARHRQTLTHTHTHKITIQQAEQLIAQAIINIKMLCWVIKDWPN